MKALVKGKLPPSKAVQPRRSPAIRNFASTGTRRCCCRRTTQKTLFYGGNHLFRSENRGDTWKALSVDLTHGPPGPSKSTGHTLTSISESPLKPGVIYVGSDDGRVHVTKDGGKNWTDLSSNLPGVPKERWISRVECSAHAAGTAYLALNRYRNNDRNPTLFGRPITA